MNSEAYIKDYLSYNEEGEDLSDVRFVFGSEGACIYQPIDDEEGDKYYVKRNEVSPELWDEFVTTFG